MHIGDMHFNNGSFNGSYCVTNGKKFRLKDVDPDDTGETTSEDKPRAKELLGKGVEVLAELQDVLYAQDQWSILLIFQAMDAPAEDQKLWFVVDELDALGAIDGLKDALARLRKFGGRCVLGFQSIAQVRPSR